MTDNADKRRRVYLTGFMGSGKSTIGPILANTLGWDFVDIDAEVETLAGCSVRTIFEEEGEQRFRNLEREVLQESQKAVETVVALGGGTIANEQSFHLIAGSGILVYLKIDREHLSHRLRNKSNRPLLTPLPGGNASAGSALDILYRTREPYYSMADVVVETGNCSVGLTVDALVRKLHPLIHPK